LLYRKIKFKRNFKREESVWEIRLALSV
jgi:hypothetical protein